MKYKVTLNKRVYEVEVEAGQAMLLDEYEAVAPAAPAPAAAPVRPVTVKDKPQGLFTGATEKAAAAAAPAAAPAAEAAPAEEDPFDSIFKIFNTK